jgi:glucuronate isomerase
MSKPLILHPDRNFPVDAGVRSIARRLYEHIRDLPIISPHGHTDPSWFSENAAFTDPANLLVTPDHYLLRMLYSQGIPMERLGVHSRSGELADLDPRQIWRTFAEHYHLFRATPSRLWLDWIFSKIFGLDVQLEPETADQYYETIDSALREPRLRPRALYDRFKIEVLATTDSPLDDLRHHRALRASDWPARIIPTFRPDPVVDPQHPTFLENLAALSRITELDALGYTDYLNALRRRRLFFISLGATASDHGPPSAATADLSNSEAEALFRRVTKDAVDPADAELFRAHMLTVMAEMSIADGLVMQLHAGSWRNYNPAIYAKFGPDVGADIPTSMNYVQALKPLLGRFGNEANFTLIVFTLDESTYTRELAPLAGHYPALKLGASWWFNDSPEGMRRFRRQTTETAGFYNTVGFTDDTRAFLSLPARHDLARRIDCGYLAGLVAEHQLEEAEAAEVATELTLELPRRTYKLHMR